MCPKTLMVMHPRVVLLQIYFFTLMTPQTTDFLMYLFQQLIMDNRKLYCTATINHFDITI
jgi:hypothetical protein